MYGFLNKGFFNEGFPQRRDFSMKGFSQMKGLSNVWLPQRKDFSTRGFLMKAFSKKRFLNEGTFQCMASSDSRTMIFKGSSNFIFGHLKELKKNSGQ